MAGMASRKPNRSPESIARNREYLRNWWRVNGAAYRAKRREAGRPLAGGHGRTEIVHSEPIPPLHTGHPLFEVARELSGIARDDRSRTLVRRDVLVREDGLSEVVLALLERRDPCEAWAAFRKRELDWIYSTTSMLTPGDDLD